VVEINDVNANVDELLLAETLLSNAEDTEWYFPNGLILRVGNIARPWSCAIVKAQVTNHGDIV
jgi:hypothetical protein